MLNYIVIQGRLTRDPELKITDSGISVCKWTLAVDRDYRNGDQKEADFFDCVAFRGTADFAHKYFEKGRAMVVSGQMYSHKWTDKNGSKRTGWEVQAQNVYFADSKNASAPAPAETVLTEIPDGGDSDLPF